MTFVNQPLNLDFSEILKKLSGDFNQAAEKTIADFFQNMPPEYFSVISSAMQLDHLKAIIYGESLKIPPRNFLIKDSERNQYTFISLVNQAGQLADFLNQIPKESCISGAKVFTSLDNKFIVDVFDCGIADPVAHSDVPSELLGIAAQIAGQETCRIISEERGPLTEFIILVDNYDGGQAFRKVVAHFAKRNIDIRSASLKKIKFNEGIVSCLQIETFTADEPKKHDCKVICCELQRLIFTDDDTCTLAANLAFDFESAEVLNACINIVHQLLSHYDRVYFSHGRIASTIYRKLEVVLPFIKRFIEAQKQNELSSEPLISEAEMEKLQLVASSSQSKEMLKQLTMVLNSVIDSNLYISERPSLSLCLKPEIFKNEELTESAYRVIYVSGLGFDGFHVRFSKVARGGLRIIPAQSLEHYTHEHERHYEEAYNLARAQNLKNKDIPEGGSKAVVLVTPGYDINKAAKHFVEGVLDLCFNSRFGVSDFIYLGPDENVSNQLICWIEQRASKKKHPLPQVFMSSKPDSGINHKEFGITSEGVNVYLREALLSRGIDPEKQMFTVKITGGTNGDVAGNLIRIMIRDYGQNVRIIGIADGTGSVEDSDGLNQQELLRLQAADLPIKDFNPKFLGVYGKYGDISTAEGLQLRNTLHNRLVADVFVPAGGRPKTIHSRNFKQFFNESGKPSSGIIVEGANLFLTDNARKELAAAGVLIFKDSSANKCGVICSSYEILAGMLLDAKEFMAIKPQYVKEVIEKLRELAALEAKVLLRAMQQYPNLTMTELSIRLSRSINNAADVLSLGLSRNSDTPENVLALLKFHVPQILISTVPDIIDRLPEDYLNRLIATIAARKIVYQEGIGYFANLSDQQILITARKYLNFEKEINLLIQSIQSSKASQKERICELLKSGGAGTALKIEG